MLSTYSTQTTPRKPPFAHWHNHINHVNAPAYLRHWLTDNGSLTAKLIAHSNYFQVQKIAQHISKSWFDEGAEIGCTKPCAVFSREVLLRCDDVPVVFAHTVLPITSNRSQWPRFKGLGNKSLGSTLFSDPLVKRGALQFAKLPPTHPAMLAAANLLISEKISSFKTPLFARRSLFYRRDGVMLVTELFLPAISALTRLEPSKKI